MAIEHALARLLVARRGGGRRLALISATQWLYVGMEDNLLV